MDRKEVKFFSFLFRFLVWKENNFLEELLQLVHVYDNIHNYRVFIVSKWFEYTDLIFA